MPFAIPEGLAPEVYPLSWLVGWWRGPGLLGYPGIEERPFVQTIQFDHDGGPYLSYASTIRLLPDGVDPADLGGVDDGDGRVWQRESGFWRCTPAAADDPSTDEHNVEVLLTDPSGHLSLYLGTVGDGRIDLASDLIAQTSTAADVSAATRLYGLVQGELMWAWDMAAFGRPMQPYASARLSRQD